MNCQEKNVVIVRVAIYLMPRLASGTRGRPQPLSNRAKTAYWWMLPPGPTTTTWHDLIGWEYGSRQRSKGIGRASVCQAASQSLNFHQRDRTLIFVG